MYSVEIKHPEGGREGGRERERERAYNYTTIILTVTVTSVFTNYHKMFYHIILQTIPLTGIGTGLADTPYTCQYTLGSWKILETFNCS